METHVKVFVGVVVGLFGVISAVLGFMAEDKKLTPADIHLNFSGTECVYPASPAYSLAVGAIILLAVSQISALAASRCCGRCRPAGDADDASKKPKRLVAGVIISVVAWIAAVIAVVFYCRGASWNKERTRNVTVAGRNVECRYFKDGVFTGAAILTLIATGLAVISCNLLQAPAATAEPDDQDPPKSGVAVGMPQWPAQGYDGQVRV